MKNIVEALYIFFYLMLIKGTLQVLGLIDDDDDQS